MNAITYVYKMLRIYIFWTHASYLLLQDSNKCAEEWKKHCTYLSSLKPQIVLLGCQPRVLWAAHTHQLSSKPKRSSIPNHRIKNGPGRAAAQGCFLTSAQHCCGHGAIRRDRGAVLVTRRQHTAASPQGECQQSLTAAAQGEQALCRVSQPGSRRVSDHHEPSHSLPGPKCFNLDFANKYCIISAKPRIPTMA